MDDANSVIVAMIYLVYSVLCMIWGSTWIAIKIGVAEAPPLYASGLRFALAATVIWGIILVSRRRLPSSVRQFVRRGVPGLFIFGGSYAMVYLAERHLSSALTSALFASFTLFVALFTTIMLPSERLKWYHWSGLMIGLVGVVLISFNSMQVSNSLFWGVLLALGAALTSAFGTVLHKSRFGGDDIVVSAGIQMLFGFVPLLIVAAIFENLGDFALNVRSIGSLLYLALMGTVVTFLGYYWLLAKIRVVVVSAIGYITPVVAIALGFLVLGEQLAGLEIAGVGLVLGGVVLVSRD